MSATTYEIKYVDATPRSGIPRSINSLYNATFGATDKWPVITPCIPGTSMDDGHSREGKIRGWYLKNGLEIGHGSFGRTYQACREGNDCKYVLKKGRVEPNELMLQQQAAAAGVSKLIRDRWRCEKEKNAYGDDIDVGVIVTDNLKETLREWSIGHMGNFESDARTDTLRRYALQAVRLIGKLHVDAKIAHRDMKDDNIMLDSKNKLFLIDFGIEGINTPKDFKTSELNNALFESQNPLTISNKK